MTAHSDVYAPRRMARIAGVLYLGTIIAGLTDMSVDSALYVSGDAATTMTRVMASETLYRVGFVANLVGMGFYVAVTAMLYALLKPAGRTLSLTAAFFSLVGCAVGAASAATKLTPFLLLGDAPYLTALTHGQLQALAMVAVRLHNVGYNVAMLNFGVYCTLIGALIYRSGFMPRIVGGLMVFAGIGWFITTLIVFLAPPVANALFPWSMLPGFVGEASLTLWLLLGGVNAPKWQARASAAAIA